MNNIYNISFKVKTNTVQSNIANFNPQITSIKVYIPIKGYKTVASVNENTNKGLGETKQFAPAIKEFSNSIYAFNKNETRNMVSRDHIANRLIRIYFDMDVKDLSPETSKRLRTSMKTSTTNKLFVSKCLIKQTNDKAVATLFLFDRTKQVFNKKIFQALQNLDLAVYLKQHYAGHINKKYNKLSKLANNKQRIKVLDTIPKSDGSNHLSLLASSFNKKKQGLKSLFFFYFLKWSLTAFNVYVTKLESKDELEQGTIKRIVTNDVYVIYTKNSNSTIYNPKSDQRSNALLTLDSKESYKTISCNKLVANSKLKIINEILYKYLHSLITQSMNNDNVTAELVNNTIYKQFKFYKSMYYKVFIQEHLITECLALNLLYKTHANKTKMGNLALGLQYILSTIYNKKIELNLVNLKYLHLNSDIYTDAVTIKLKNRVNGALRTLATSLTLVQVPMVMLKHNINNNFNSNFNIPLNREYRGLNLNGLYSMNNVISNKYFELSKDKVTSVLQNMFAKSEYVNKPLNLLKKGYKNFNNVLHHSILSSLSYKWVTGVRLQAKGRISKRFTASRSMFKTTIKGSLKNLSLQARTNNLNYEIPTTYMVRNSVKPNIQYKATGSTRRTGSFGVKGWISNN